MQELNRRLREEQDADYQRSLEADRERERKRAADRAEEEARQLAAQQAQDAQRSAFQVSCLSVFDDSKAWDQFIEQGYDPANLRKGYKHKFSADRKKVSGRSKDGGHKNPGICLSSVLWTESSPQPSYHGKDACNRLLLRPCSSTAPMYSADLGGARLPADPGWCRALRNPE